MAKIEDTIEALEAKLKQAKAVKQLRDAKLKPMQTRLKRQADTRRKIIIGGAILGEIKKQKFSQKTLLTILNPLLTRPADRALFDFSLLAQDSTKPTT